MVFHDVQCPPNIAYGPVGGARFNTRIVQNPSDHEQRNIKWINPLGKWNVAHELKTQAELDIINNFFHARYGRAHTFRFKVWDDFKARMDNSESLPVILTVTSSPNLPNTQLVKHYSSGGFTYTRNITLPSPGTVVLYANETEISGTNYSINYSTGIIEFDEGYAPGVGVEITADYEFDVLVRFDTDEIESSIEFYNINTWANIPIVEVRA